MPDDAFAIAPLDKRSGIEVANLVHEDYLLAQTTMELLNDQVGKATLHYYLES